MQYHHIKPLLFVCFNSHFPAAEIETFGLLAWLKESEKREFPNIVIRLPKWSLK